MALEEVVLAYYEPPFYDLQASFGFSESQNFDSIFPQEDHYENTSTTFLHNPLHEIVHNVAKITKNYDQNSETNAMGKNQATRRRSRAKRNNEETDINPRMTHITVERNRRKLMNEYLSVLRSLMPESYVPRCDQASIVGGAINFIKELEHRLHNFNDNEPNENSIREPFSNTFNLPQFSMCSPSSSINENVIHEVNALADIEVSLIESHASLKIRSRKRPKLLVNMVSGLQSLGFIILHLNISTVSDFILYCFSTKMEDYCKLTSVADIANAVHEMIKIHDDAQQ